MISDDRGLQSVHPVRIHGRRSSHQPDLVADMTARRFDPARNQQEIRDLYGPAHAGRQPDWEAIVAQALTRSPDVRDQRDPETVGKSKRSRRQGFHYSMVASPHVQTAGFHSTPEAPQ